MQESSLLGYAASQPGPGAVSSDACHREGQGALQPLSYTGVIQGSKLPLVPLQGERCRAFKMLHTKLLFPYNEQVNVCTCDLHVDPATSTAELTGGQDSLGTDLHSPTARCPE